MNGTRRLSFIARLVSIVVIVLSFVAVFSSQVYGATGINQTINFQGKVTNTDGTNVTDGVYDFVFKLYDGAASGSTNLFTESWTAAALWSSTMSSAPSSGGESLTYSTGTNESTIKVGQIIWNVTKGESVVVVAVNTGTNVITISPTRQAWAGSDTVTNKIYVKDGIFRVALNGLNQDLSAVNFNSDTIFFGVNFNGDGEMKPRIQYTASPYAMNARKVGGLTVTDTTGTLTVPNGKTIQFADSFTTSGANPLTLTTTGTTNVTLPLSGTVATLAGTETFTSKTIGSTGLTFSGASTDIITGTDEHLVIVPNGTGNIGIGSTAPNAYLLISTVTAKDLFRVNDNGDGDTSPFIVDQVGNVGIGVTAASAVLDIRSGTANSDVVRLLASDGSRLGRFTETAGGAGWFEVDDSSGVAVTLFRADAGASYIRTGNVGIGVTAPGSKLSIAGGVGIGSTASSIFSTTAAPDGGLIVEGSVGIGTTLTSGADLTIKSGTVTSSLFFSDGRAYVGYDAAVGAGTAKLGSSLGKDVAIVAGGIDRLHVQNSTGYVGIGTTSPNNPLEILNTATQLRLSYDASNSSTVGVDSSGYLSFQSAGTAATGRVQIGLGGAGNSTPDYFGLDVKSDTGDPAGGFEGAMYYNTFDNKFRCYQGSAWTDCIGTGGAGPWTDGSGISYLTDTAEDFAVGAATLAAPLSVDVSANTVRIGTGSTANAVLSMYASDADTGSITYTTNDGWAFEGGNVGVGTTAATYKLDVVSADTTGILQLTGNSITSGTALNMTLNGLTSGKGINISSTSTALTSGSLMYLDWSPSSSATATGDIFGINIGPSGTIGNLFNLKNNGSSIFSVSQTQITNGLPTNFTAAGDVSIAYDLVFTNQTISYIKSSAPLSIEAGEIFESNDLTLRTYNAGSIIADVTGNGGFAVGNSVTPIGKFHVEGKQTGKALTIFNETGNQDIFTASAAGSTKLVINNGGNVGIGTTSPLATLDVRGKVFLNDGGSAGAPVLAFWNDDNLGVYRAGADILSFVANGQPGLTLDGTAGVGRFIVGPRNSQPVSRIQIIDDNNNTASGITFGESAGTYMQLYKSASNKLTIGGGYLGIGSTNPGAPLEIQNTATQVKLSYDTSNSATIGVDSSGYLSFQTAGTATTSRLQIGLGGAGNSTPDYFGLDVKSDTGDPAGGFEGAMYYNTFDNKFRCYQGSAWTDCIGTGGAGPWTDGSGITYLTDVAEDFAVGAATLAAPLSVDVSANTVRIGTGSTANAVLNMFASDGDTGSLTYSTSDAFGFTGGNVGIGTTAPNNGLEVLSTTSPQVRFAYDTSNYVTFAVSSTGAVTVDATGASAGLTFSDAVTASTTLASNSTLTVGSTGNTLTFNPASGPLYAGTARPTRQMRIPVEYPGATLTASGSATITGSMTADTVRDTTAGWMNYYEWTSTQASLQNYTIAVKIQLPSDFSAWATSNAIQINYVTEVTDNAKNKLDMSIYNMSTNADKVVYQTLTNVSGTSGVWTTITVDDSQLVDTTAPDIDTADQTAIIFLKPYSLVDAVNCTAGYDNGCYVRLGDIVLNYLGKN